MGAAQSEPLSLKSADVGRAKAALEDAGYVLGAVVEALGVGDVRMLDRVPWDAVQLRLGDTGIDPLISLFMLGAEVPRTVAERALPVSIEWWEELGLIRGSANGMRGSLRLVPDSEFLLASDWPSTRGTEMAADHVLGNNPTAAMLDNITIRDPIGRALDLGTGCGVQGLIATRHADHVTATDLNPRAVNVAAFNALLNGTEMECLQGDLFEPVNGRTFDLITSNPPFVISPASAFLFRDSQHGGEGVTRKIIAGADTHLNEGGFCQLLCNLAHVDGRDWEEGVRAMIDGNGCDAWVLHLEEIDPAVYAASWIRHQEESPDAFRATLGDWMEFYEREGITGISWAVITMRKRSGGDNWFSLSKIDGEIAQRCGGHVRRCFEGRGLVLRTGDEALLETHPRAAPETRLEQVFEPTPDGWGPVRSRLSAEAGLPGVGGGVDAHVANLVIRCDGKQPLREILRQTAEDAGADLGAMLPEGLKLARHLFEGGHLTAG